MPKYELTKDHYLQDKKAGKEPQAHSKGEVIDWAGTPSLHMKPVDKEAKERVDARMADFSEKKKAAMAARGSVGWNRTFGENMSRIITQTTKDDAPPQSNSGAGRRSKKAA